MEKIEAKQSKCKNTFKLLQTELTDTQNKVEDVAKPSWAQLINPETVDNLLKIIKANKHSNRRRCEELNKD